MISINAAVIDLKRLELLADADSAIHELDARVKVVVTILFIVSVASYGKYEIAGLLPFFIFPALVIHQSGLPLRFIAKKIVMICPLVAMVGIFNPLVDQTELLQIHNFHISGGWISLGSLIIRSLLTVGAAFILVGTTGFAAICHALERLGLPQLFAVLLLFLHRYIFVLADETARTSRARELRSCGKKGLGIASFGSLAGHLLLRTWQRAERIYTAMRSRAFVGQFHSHRQRHFGSSEFCFLLGWSAFFLALRTQDLIGTIRAIFSGVFS